MNRIGWLMLAGLLAGCGSSAVDGNDLISGDGDSGDYTEFSGRVTLGTPVDRATVRAWVHNLNGTWDEVQEETTTDANGVFKVRVPASKSNLPLRLIATGATAQYKEIYGGMEATLGSEGRVMVDLSASSHHEGAVVHLGAWTTMAACLADGYSRGHQRQPPPGWTDAISQARLRIRDHLAGEQVLDLGMTGPSDLSRGPWPYPNPSTTLGLAAAGLSVLARTGFEPETTTAELVTWLCLDISDGLFDGKRRAPEEGEEDMPSLSVPDTIDADTTRYALVAATHAFLSSAVNESGVTPDAVAGPGEFYDVVSMDNCLLYPDSHPPTRFDPIPPVLQFDPDTPAEGAILAAAFTITVQGTDPFGPVSITFDGTTEPGPLTADPEPLESARVLEVDPDLFTVQGSTTFLFTGTDVAGNVTNLERTFILDSRAPVMSVVTPDQLECHDSWPEAIFVLVTDDEGGVASVTLENGLPCEAADGDLWSCPPPTATAKATTVTASDVAGNEAEVIVWLCRDYDPPAISFGTVEDLDWWGPSFPMDYVFVQITDPSGVAGWTTVDAAGETVQPISTEVITDGVSLTFTLAGEGPFSLTVTAQDPLKNETTRTKSLLWDDEHPVFDEDVQTATVIGSLHKMTFFVSVTDQHSGLAKVEVVSAGVWDNLGESIPEPNTGPMIVQVSGTPILEQPYDDLVEIEVEATDMAGNKSQHLVPVLMDLHIPDSSWSPTNAYDETDCIAEFNGNGELVYDCPSPTEVLSLESCEDICPPIVKLASRLDYDAETLEGINTKQIPSLEFLVHDICPLDDPAQGQCPMFYSWTFFRGDTALLSHELIAEYFVKEAVFINDKYQSELTYNETIYMGAEDLFGAPAGEADFGDSNIPDRIVVSFTDAGGNTQTREINLNLTILPPPIFLAWTTHADTEIQVTWGATPSTLATILESETHIMDQVAGSPGVEVAAFILLNPTTVPVLADLPVVPTHVLEVFIREGYLGNYSLPDGCSDSTCTYATGPLDEVDFSAGICEAAVIFETNMEITTSPVTVEFLAPDGTLEWDDGWLLLPAGSITEGSLQVSMEPAPEVLPVETEQAYWATDGSFEEVPIHFLSGPDHWAACGMSEQTARRFRTTPALRAVHSHTATDASVLQLATRNPGAENGATANYPSPWYVSYINQWPANSTPPSL